MKELLQFIKHPVYSDKNEPLSARYFIELIVMYFLFALLIGAMAAFIIDVFNISHLKNITSIKIILVAVFLAPFYEEILFRALLKFNKKTVWLFVVTVVALIVLEVIRFKFAFAIPYTIFLVFIVAMLLIFKENKIHNYISKNIKFFYYLTSITFGLVHLTNFSGNIYLILLFSIFLVGPQLILGFILGFIRLKYGLKYSILFHMAVNAPILFMLFKVHW